MSHEFESDISLKHVILKVQDYIRTCFRSWKFIGLSAVLLGLLVFFVKLNNPNTYQANLTFMLNDDQNGSLSGLTAILGSFGLGSLGGAKESSLDRILELAKSRRITQNAIFAESTISGKKGFLANHLIEILEENNEWEASGFFESEDSLSLKDFRFEHDSLDIFNTLENKALKKIHKEIAGNENYTGILDCSYNELTGIMTLSIEGYNDEFVVKMVNSLFENLSTYYIEKAIEKQKYDYDIIKEKYDSINYALSNVEYKLASFEDSNKNLYRKKDILAKNRLSTERQKLQFMSGKAEEQLQLAQLSLENKTPFIQVIDKPLLPLKPTNNPPVILLILGCFVGGFLATSFVILKKFYLEIMSSND